MIWQWKLVTLQRNSKRRELRCNFNILIAMHKALKKMQERTAKKISYLFFDRSIEVERIHFSLRWTTLFAQVANQLDEAGYLSDLFSSSSQTYLKFRLKDGHTIQLMLNREYEDEPLLVIQFGPFNATFNPIGCWCGNKTIQS